MEGQEAAGGNPAQQHTLADEDDDDELPAWAKAFQVCAHARQRTAQVLPGCARARWWERSDAVL